MKIVITIICVALVSYFVYGLMSEHYVKKSEMRCQKKLKQICGACEKKYDK